MNIYKKQSQAVITGVALLAALAGPAWGDTKTSTFQVTATVLKNCTIDSTNLAFGNYDPLAGTAVNQTSTVNVKCTLSTPYTVALNTGANAGNATAFSSRAMRGPADNLLKYQLYTDSARTAIWGDGTNGTQTISGTGNGVLIATPQARTVYGQVPGGQDVQPGAYADTVVATITY
ncbi:spore coat U domain-containing protein [uncultured Salinisphaera sp.]|uniref:Csu type fimbrial protein n=1 Tax=uncultured Salinisphaera sp. TaxID=359372 RepID=UPI0032B19C43|tara:strand:+ start:1530 stop:2057 length:528 start_codon:yes stop_codon:yes gene_type:complete